VHVKAVLALLTLMPAGGDTGGAVDPAAECAHARCHSNGGKPKQPKQPPLGRRCALCRVQCRLMQRPAPAPCSQPLPTLTGWTGLADWF
jgi:hypothetical protein